MRAVVTGGAGFIGSHVVDALLARGDEVTVIDDLSTGRREFVNEAATLVVHDVREPFEADADVVYHLAAQADVGTSMERPGFDAAVNVVGTVNALEAARAAGARLVFSSTGGAIYGEVERPASEDAERRPVSAYGIAKLAAETYVAGWNRIHGSGHVVLRFANVYGPRQSAELEGGVVSIFLERLARGEETLVFGDGEQSRDFVYVGDVVAAVLAAPRPRRRHLQHRYRHRDDGQRPAPSLRADGRSRRGAAAPRPARRRCPQERPRRHAGRAGAGLAGADAAGGGPPADVGLRPAATLVAIRVAFWFGAAAALTWAPAPERRLIGDAYGPASDFLFRTFSQWDARWFLQIAMHGYEEVPQAAAFFPVYPALVHALAWATGSILVAGVVVSLARPGSRPGCWRRSHARCSAGAARTTPCSTSRSTRSALSSPPSTRTGSSSPSRPARSSRRREGSRSSRACSVGSRSGRA